MFDERETASILAGLRALQRQATYLSLDIIEIASNCGRLEPLSDEEINALAERINFGEEEEEGLSGIGEDLGKICRINQLPIGGTNDGQAQDLRGEAEGSEETGPAEPEEQGR